MTIERVYISYPDFRMFDVIDSEQFDVNNNEFQEKINELVDTLNLLYTPKEDATKGSELISMKPIAPIAEGDSVQAFLENLITRLQSIEHGLSGSELIGSPAIGDLEGNTVHEQLMSIDALIRELRNVINAIGTKNTKDYLNLYNELNTQKTTLNNHNHDTRYFTKEEITNLVTQGETTVRMDVFTITSVDMNTKTFTYTDHAGTVHTSSIDESGAMLFALTYTYTVGAHQLTVIVDDVLNLSTISGGLIEVSENQFKVNAELHVGQEITCRYFERVRISSEHSLSYGTEQPALTSGSDMWFKVVG